MAERMKEHGKKVCRKHEKSGVFFLIHWIYFLYEREAYWRKILCCNWLEWNDSFCIVAVDVSLPYCCHTQYKSVCDVTSKYYRINITKHQAHTKYSKAFFSVVWTICISVSNICYALSLIICLGFRVFSFGTGSEGNN